MDFILIYAVVFINLAFILYTVGVWSEKIQKNLKVWHVNIFWLGFICDTIGTSAMGEIAGAPFQFNFHAITGISAIVLMLFHAIWATVVTVRKNENMKLNFHKLSIFVWVIWLIPMLSGMILGVIR